MDSSQAQVSLIYVGIADNVGIRGRVQIGSLVWIKGGSG